jgi:hypothetical protein
MTGYRDRVPGPGAREQVGETGRFVHDPIVEETP